MLVAGVLVLIYACSHQNIPIETIHSSNLCAVSERQIKTIKTQQALKDIITGTSKIFIQKSIDVPQVDFNSHSLVLIALGQQSTTGYSINLTARQATLENGKLMIPVSITKPDKGQFQAQMISSPCRIYSLPKIDFTEIHIGNN